MSDRNPEYDFKWCPGCGDFGVKRALEWAMQTYAEETETPMSNSVIVAGIGLLGAAILGGLVPETLNRRDSS